MKNTPQKTPEVGMGATGGAGSDCYPFTIVEVVSPKTIVVQADSAVMNSKGDYFGNQIWDITPNPNGGKETYTLRKNGRWILKGSPMTDHWSGISIGHRRRYEDPHF